MARSDLLLSLVRSGSSGDQVMFERTVEALIAEERAKQHHTLADQLAQNLRSNGSRFKPGPGNTASARHLYFERRPERSLSGLLLPKVVEESCKELIEEQHRSDLLRSYGLEPRHRVLLTGPPGNGKTSLAEALAHGLAYPLVVVRYEGVIGSYLGETASRLDQLFEHVRSTYCVLFFDEFDVLAKERGDVHETGEIKRVVSSILLQIDRLPSHVVVVAASNHPELLDRAAWRRFQLRLELPLPTRPLAAEFFRRFEARAGQTLGYKPETLADKVHGASFGELEELCLDALRRYILGLPDASLKAIMRDRFVRVKPNADSSQERQD